MGIGIRSNLENVVTNNEIPNIDNICCKPKLTKDFEALQIYAPFNGISNYTPWTDGTNIYYSYGTTQYVLNKSTSTWETKVWNGLTNFYSSGIWSDGSNIYYSSGTTQYVLNKSTSTWSTKTWSGLTNFYGNNIWTDGSNIYCDVNGNNYKLQMKKIKLRC